MSTAHYNATNPTPSNLIKTILSNTSPVFVILGIILVIVAGIVLVSIYFIRKRLKYEEKFTKKPRFVKVDEPIFNTNEEKFESRYGYLDVSVMYDKRVKELIVRDIMANNLFCSHEDEPDCFVKVFLRGHRGKKVHVKKTKVKIDDFTPYFSESFTFPVENVKSTVLYFQIIDDNPHGTDLLLGEGSLDMGKLPVESYMGLVCPTSVILAQPMDKQGLGEVCVIISTKESRLSVIILEARDVALKYATVTFTEEDKWPSVHVTVSFYLNKVRKKHFQTKKVRNTNCPYFFETFPITIKPSELKKMYLKVALFESVPLRKTHKVGEIYIGNPDMNARINAMGRIHWDAICDRQTASKAMWHSLSK